MKRDGIYVHCPQHKRNTMQRVKERRKSNREKDFYYLFLSENMDYDSFFMYEEICLQLYFEF